MMHINNYSPATFTRLEKSILSFYLGTTTAGGELRGRVNPLKDRLKIDRRAYRLFSASSVSSSLEDQPPLGK